MFLLLHNWLQQRSYLTRSLIAGMTIACLAIAALLVVVNRKNLAAWDLTQPQGVLIAGFLSGPFLITAAYIAFRGQKDMRREERRKFDEQMRFERTKFADTLAEQRHLSDQQAFRARVQQRADLGAQRKQHEDLLAQQAGQHRREIRQQAKSLRVTKQVERKRLISAAEIEERKHRRQVVFESIGAAMKSLVEVRAAYIAIDKAMDDDRANEAEAAEYGMDYDGTAELDAIATCRVACDQATGSAAMLLLIELEDSYLALMEVVQHVGARMVLKCGESFTIEEVHEFGDLWSKAIGSLRGKYNQA